MIQDPIADMFVRIMNAQRVLKENVAMPLSKEKVAIAKLLADEGYVAGHTISTDENKKPALVITLKYFQGKPVINKMQRVSSSGERTYVKSTHIPRVMGGLGIAIISTSKGLLTDRKARALKVGGEVIGFVE